MNAYQVTARRGIEASQSGPASQEHGRWLCAPSQAPPASLSPRSSCHASHPLWQTPSHQASAPWHVGDTQRTASLPCVHGKVRGVLVSSSMQSDKTEHLCSALDAFTECSTGRSHSAQHGAEMLHVMQEAAQLHLAAFNLPPCLQAQPR